MKAIAPLVPASCCLAVLRRPLSGFACAARAALCAITALAVSAISANACGVSWECPTPSFAPPFADERSEDYRFKLWRELGSLKVAEVRRYRTDEPLEISLNLGFDPMSGYASVLGVGFELALFDSRLTWLSNNEVRLHHPGGSTRQLKVKGKNRFVDFEYAGTYNPQTQQATIKAPCNWTMNFEKNRLVGLKSPNGVVFTIVRLANGEQQLLLNGRIIVSLKPDWDPKTTQKIYRLKFSDKTIILRMGTRPVVIKEKGKKERIIMTPALAGIEYENWKRETDFLHIPKQRLSFKRNEMTLGNEKYEWDETTGRLVSARGTRYEFPTVMGISCKREVHGASSFLEGSTPTEHIQQRDNGPIYYATYLPVNKFKAREDLKSLVKIDPKTKKETLLKRIWYDEDREITRMYFLGEDGEGMTQYFKHDSILLERASDKQLIWECKYDEKGDIVQWRTKSKEYRFEHKKATKQVIVKLKGSDGEKVFPVERFNSLFSQLQRHSN
jgi:hypothetical protein